MREPRLSRRDFLAVSGGASAGLVLTFYFPRRRAWARISGDRVALAFTADRYVDQDREFGQLADNVAERVDGVRIEAPGEQPERDPDKRAGTGSRL